MCLPHVLETGRGSAAALSIIYIEICTRMGLQISAAVLEEGRHCVVWPTHKPLQLASGEDVVVDVYSGGALYRLKEVRCFSSSLFLRMSCPFLKPLSG